MKDAGRRTGARRTVEIVLHGPRTAPLVDKIARALVLKKACFEWRDPTDGKNPRPDLGEPTLAIDGDRIGVPRLLQRIEERFPEPPLLARDPRTADAQRRLADWVDESFRWYWTRWRQLQLPATGTAPLPASPPGEPPRPAGMSLRDWIGQRLRLRAESQDSLSTRLIYEIGHRIGDLSRLLADRPYFYADRISLADLSVACAVRASCEISDVAKRLEEQPRLSDFVARVERETRSRHFR